MQTVSAGLVSNKKVLLRMDLDVPIKDGRVTEDFRLKAGASTLKLCVDYAEEVVMMGHIGRPAGEDPNFSVEPIYDWLNSHGFGSALESKKLRLLENLRFESGEDKADLAYAKEILKLVQNDNNNIFYVNEAFAAHHPAASTTVLPTLLPHAAGLQFSKEVAMLTKVKDNPAKPLVAIIGGVKVEDKLPAALALSKIADYVLVGGKIAKELSDGSHSPREAGQLSDNILLAELTEDGEDIAQGTVDSWQKVIMQAKMVVWNGPLGKVEDPKNDQSRKIAQFIIDSKAQSIVGGGDTVAFLDKEGLLDKFSFVSTGGGAMLEFLGYGTLPTIEALK